MPRILDEPVAESPLWLEVAGYPRHLNATIRGGAWPVFKKLVELDCAANERPAVFASTVAGVAAGAGVEAKVVRRVAEGLRKQQMLRCFLPETDDEEALFEFLTPFKPPLAPELVRQRLAAMPGAPAERLRYIDELPARRPAADSLVQQVVDAYLDSFGPKLNPFVLDELALLAGRFPIADITSAFARAVQMQRPSLRWVIQDLAGRARKRQATS